MWTHPANPALSLVAIDAQRSQDLTAAVVQTLRAAPLCTATEAVFDLVELVRLPARTYRAAADRSMPPHGLFAASATELASSGLAVHQHDAFAEPLAGLTIVVTRSAHQVAPLAALLEAAGGRVIAMPAIDIVPPAEPSRVDAALRSLSPAHAVVFTSENGAERTFAHVRALGLDARLFAGKIVDAIGLRQEGRRSLCGGSCHRWRDDTGYRRHHKGDPDAMRRETITRCAYVRDVAAHCRMDHGRIMFPENRP